MKIISPIQQIVTVNRLLPNGTGKSHVPYNVLTKFIVLGKFVSMKPAVSRRSRAHVENSPPPEKLNSNKNSLARNIFILKTTKRKAVPLSSKRGIPPFKICSISRFTAPREASDYRRLKFAVADHLIMNYCLLQSSQPLVM